MRQIAILFAVTMMMSSFTLAKENLEIENQAIIAIVVSNEQIPTELKLSAKNLSLIFWRKQLFWPQGVPIKPVNLRSQDPLRIQFSEATLGSTPEAQIDYWNGQYFNGILPPYSVNSEEAVLRYIANTKGAIGYVNACNVDERVQGLLWLMPNGEMRKSKPALDSCVK
jgi:ABC-type phosphate transport system substrate-binding protein